MTKRARLISSLAKDDFHLFEDGQPQPIKYFTRETDLPLTIGLLVDVSGSQENLIEIERRAASELLPFRVSRRKDVAFLISFGADSELLQDITGSPRLLQDGLNHLKLNAGFWRLGTGTGSHREFAQRHRTLRRGLAGCHRSTGERGGAQGDRADHGWRGPGQHLLASSRRSKQAQKADAVIYSIYYVDPSRLPWGAA